MTTSTVHNAATAAGSQGWLTRKHSTRGIRYRIHVATPMRDCTSSTKTTAMDRAIAQYMAGCVWAANRFI